MADREPFTVEYFIGRLAFPPHTVRWVRIIDVPSADLEDARACLVAQGCQWTTRRRWRIVNRAGEVVREFEPEVIQQA